MPRTSTERRAKAKASPLGLDEHIGHLLRRAYQRASETLVEHIAAAALTAPQFAVLARLAEQAPVSQNRLGRLVAMEPANIHDVVRRLARSGLVETRRDALDRRLTLVGLTPAGRSLIAELLPVSEAALEATLSGFDASERALFYALLRRFIAGGPTRT